MGLSHYGQRKRGRPLRKAMGVLPLAILATVCVLTGLWFFGALDLEQAAQRKNWVNLGTPVRRGLNNKYEPPPMPSNYGFDQSFPVTSVDGFVDMDGCAAEVDCSKHWARKKCPATCGNVWQQNYNRFIQGCEDKYGRKSCMRVEAGRFDMNKNQAKKMKTFTDNGYHKMKVPPELFERIKNFWEHSPRKHKLEAWTDGNTYVNHWESPTYMVSLEDRAQNPIGEFEDNGYKLKEAIWAGIKPILEEWTGQTLHKTSLYGIRVYREGAILAPHVDRLPLVSSAIINVAQDVDEPWPLEIYDHVRRVAHNVTMEPGDLVLYESHVCTHGRPFPLKGNWYSNIFVHFAPDEYKAGLRGHKHD
uniref:Uncharacterized protein n=1 Tax=Phaeomonas parva TaxID=124430 RepID=A0A7S1UF35_9STRA|mmetsp:Transcript_44958/g.140807  ORF Transcript_44958/g.140807 Transcript_44958/m.140807 type:complete len:360 (+) Transcript_44958:126-1205(+)